VIPIDPFCCSSFEFFRFYGWSTCACVCLKKKKTGLSFVFAFFLLRVLQTELNCWLYCCTARCTNGLRMCLALSGLSKRLHYTAHTDELRTYNSVCVIQCGGYIWFTLLWRFAVECPSYFYFAALPSCFVRSTQLNVSCLTFCASRPSTAFAALSQHHD
jgi:hypothetical protein